MNTRAAAVESTPGTASFFSLLVAALTALLPAPLALAQGSLTPPAGTPAPTMKTLDQVEARTALPRPSDYSGGTLTFPIVISASGSYYLTQKLSVHSSDAIQISADNVTLDLNGFTIFSDNATGSGSGVSINGSNISVHDGTIVGTTTYNGTSFTAGGFNDGIHSFSGSNTRVERVTVRGVASNGILLPAGQNCQVKACQADVIAGASVGIYATVVSDCVVTNASGIGVAATVAENVSVAVVDGTSAAISATVVTNSWGNNTGTGYGISAQKASGCFGYSGRGTGIQATLAQDCIGQGSYTSGNGSGISVSDTAQNCSGTAFGSTGTGAGILAAVALNCTGRGLPAAASASASPAAPTAALAPATPASVSMPQVA